MSLTRFLGATSREALRRVREALGADAMIVSNREVDGGVEIVATTDVAAASAAPSEHPGAAPTSAPRLPSASPAAASPGVERVTAPAVGASAHPAPSAAQAPRASRFPSAALSAAYDAQPVAPTSYTPAPGARFVGMPPRMRAPSSDDAGDADFLPALRARGMPPPMRAPQPTDTTEADSSRSPGRAEPPSGLAGRPDHPLAASVPTPPAVEPLAGATQPAAAASLHASVDRPAGESRRREAPPDGAWSVDAAATGVPNDTADVPGEASPAPAGMAPVPSVQVPAPAQEPPSVLRALDAMQDSLSERIDGLLWRQQAPESPVALVIYRTLLAAGFSAALARALATRAPASATTGDAMAWVTHELAKRLPVGGQESAMFATGGVYALVGPTGVGKTTTTAKLAARWVMAHGAQRVAMLTTDGYRVGAHEQLRIYGRILGVPVLAVSDADQLQHALRELQDKHVVLIDTVGMSQRDRNLAEQAALLCAAGRPVRRLLLLNAASHGDTLDEVAHAYRQDEAGGLSGCILTKVDEARQLGTALDIAIRHRLPIHYVSDGQKVPENVALPNPAALVARALEGAQQALFAPTEADLAAVWSRAGVVATAPADTGARQARSRRHLQAALSGLGGQGPIDETLQQLSRDRATVLARQVWRGFQAAGDADALADLMLSDVRAHAAQATERHVIAWHGKVRQSPVAAGQRACPGTVLWSDRGEPLAAPVRHLVTANGVLATFARDAEPVSAGADAALARAAWVADALQGQPIVHGFDGFLPTQASRWQEQGWSWFARCGAPQRMIRDDTRIAAGALAKLVGYAPAGEVTVGEVDCTCWVGGAAVDVALVAGQPLQALRFVSMRCVDAEGIVRAQAFALTNASADTVDTLTVGRWLALAESARRAEPWMQSAIDACTRADADATALSRALLAGAQLGLSTWRLAQPGKPGDNLLGLPSGNSPKARKAALDQMARMFGVLDMHEDAAPAC